MLSIVHSLVLLVIASATRALEPAQLSPLVLHESRAPPPGWTPVRRADPSTRLPLRIGLAQRNLENIDQFLLDVSHPDSPNYGRHWSAERLRETFAPDAEAEEAVRDWLEEELGEGSVKARPGGWLTVDVSIAEAERLLGTEYFVWQYGENGREHLACEGRYHLPEHVSHHVDLVLPTLHFDVKMPRTVRRELDARSKNIGAPGNSIVHPKFRAIPQSPLASCDAQITPDCLRALYDFAYYPVATDKNTIGIVEYSPEAFLDADMDAFFANFSPSQVGQRPAVISIDGGYEQTLYEGFSINGEAELDLQYAMALVGANQNVTLYQVGDLVEGGSFNNFLDALDASYCTYEGGDDPELDGTYPDPYGGYQGSENCGTAPLSNIISTSYGYTEAYLGAAYIQRQCYEYAKLGLMGVTFLYSSGDDGVAGNGQCLDADGNESYDGTRFDPGFPGTCPYVTAVGATQIVPGNSVWEPEVACDTNIYSGGGFSNVFALPSWQRDAVEGYLTNYPPPYAADIYNSSGNSRGYPDIAANGLNYTVMVDGEATLVSGTSCASPVAASILSAINDARIALGKSAIGFINPTIYTPVFQQAFNDVTSGNNPGCGTDGFSSEPGWDPVTGLGTPNFPELLALWLALP
ncbi:subtilisin-like protein [Laetiporus sulphureus 93-53]|uniref:tripeptidyl-peptidase II n=1 Tax=Laetiporus sulphureus 93-53 TaxID=1314785 RepID=A0A165GJV6_9APHY|nr:subtilisin-like protein [Laetiporus sulphureus 93-53]KZT10453.1 subtilisin-like protein [Laetiporus sulphureus 93-53]